MRTIVRLLVPILVIVAFASLPALANQAAGQPCPSAALPGQQSYVQPLPSQQSYVQPLPGQQMYSQPVPVSAAPGIPVAVDLHPYLQAEVNEVAMLTAQSNSLRQSGDTVTADMIASYIPDHQMQIARLQAAMGNTPDVLSIQPSESPFLGSREDIIAHDRQAHMAVMDQYRTLFGQTVGNPGLHELASLGLNGASRHFDSLTIAEATVSPSTVDQTTGLMAALSLEKGAVWSLQTQAEQLAAIGDFRDARLLRGQVPAHLQQIASLQSTILSNGGDPTFAVPALVPPLNSPPAIQVSLQTSTLQMADTYAVPLALAPGSQLASIAQSGRQVALADLSLTGTTVPIA